MGKLYEELFDEDVVKWVQDEFQTQVNGAYSLNELYNAVINRTSLIVNNQIDESYRKYMVGRAIFNSDTIKRPLSSLAKYAYKYCKDLDIDTDLGSVTEDLTGQIDEKYMKLAEGKQQ